ncbi:hypothetical protein QZH41_018688 [Actinostola sp. cb2023]|nr:hypothetical protein QZH41_018688 [Actinostola sp. cb2023]
MEIEAETLSELREVLQEVFQALTTTNVAVTSVSSGCELFLRFITLAALDNPDFKECKRVLIERGQLFLKRAAAARAKIAKLSDSFIKDGSTILTHSRSRVVLEILKLAAKQKKRFNVFITESAPDKSGCLMHDQLKECGIPSTVILDSAVGYIIEKINLVLVGAEGVVESGGIINKIGTYQMAVMTKAANKPFYVVAESFKFVRLYPLNQEDVPNKNKPTQNTLRTCRSPGLISGSLRYATRPYGKFINLPTFKLRLLHISIYTTSHPMTGHPVVDYTPPSYITLLFTDLGVLTPSAVSDELIKLYL